ncbi:MAG TPA: MFS transporter, partial [Treponemataceae bacterium]|nr:MFS transporter [Treponemataceae bacterium]
MSEQIIKRNRFTFGLGTIGRDMVYSMVSMYLIFYLSDILKLDDAAILYATNIMLAARIFDALNDPIMGTIVDNTKSRFGKFKPWIVFGSLLSGLITILLFTDIGLKGSKFIAMFAVLYVAWGIAFTTNDISFWSMLPSLSTSQKEREKIGAFARICANIGLFFVV